MGIYGDKEMKNFTKELNAFYKAKADLKKKIVEYFDTLDEEVEFYATVEKEEMRFVKISNQTLEEENGFEFDYRYLSVEELIDLLEGIIRFHDVEKQKRLEE